MQRGEGSTQFIHAWPKMAYTVLLLSLLWNYPRAGAGGIEGTPTNFSAGDRVTFQAIPRASSSDESHIITSLQQNSEFLSTSLVPSLNRFGFKFAATRFTSDIERGNAMWSAESRSLLLAQDGPTLEALKPSNAFLHTPLDFTRLEANGPTDISPTFIHGYINHDNLYLAFPFWFGPQSTMAQMDLNLDTGQDLFIFANHRLTSTWDMGIGVPVFFGPSSSWPRLMGGTEEGGIGDIILQTQYKFPRMQLWWPDVMIRGQVKLPTGDKASYWGTGDTDLKVLLKASRSFGWLTPHVDLGLRWTTEGSKQNDLSYVAGLYAQVRPSLGLFLDVLGRWEPNGDGIEDHPINLALGAKWYSHRFVVSSNIFLPMNKLGGYRPEVTWATRVEFLF